jgi:hypothetical protein
MNREAKKHARLVAGLKTANWCADQIPVFFRGEFTAEVRHNLAERIVADQEAAIPDADDPAPAP